MSAVYSGDPWATSGQPLESQIPQHKNLTRNDRVLLAAKAIVGWDLEDNPMGKGVAVDWAAEVLNAAYPLVESAEEIDALDWMTVIVNDHGRVYQRELVGGLARVDGSDVGTLEVWAQPGEHETGRKPRRTSSATLAATGPWTVVHGGRK